ncbi:MAG: hypothetical protein ACT4PP_08690 [Sporichthyaceae bacterium]
MADRRLIVAERDGGCWHVLGTRSIEPGEVVTAGRAGELPLGLTLDTRVSRRAVTLTCAEDGWSITSTNRNGVLLHEWGAPVRYARREETLAAPRVALRIVGSVVREHWVLLEDDTRFGPYSPGDGEPGQKFTPDQLASLRLLFPDLLEWPPVLTEWPATLDDVARARGESVEEVRTRLEALLGQARTHGLSPEVSVTDPDYVHLLVTAGRLRPEEFGPAP